MAYPQNPYGFPVHGGYPSPSYPGMAYPSSSPKTYYLIKSHLSDQVLDVQGGSGNPGSKVVTWPMKNWSEWHNQLWYDDPMTGTIRSKLNDYCLDLSGSDLVINPYYPGNPNQLWERYGTSIRNRSATHRVLDVSGANKSSGAKMIAWNNSGAINQQFDFRYIPGLTEPYMRRDFLIVSEMHNKVLDINGGNPSAGSAVIVWPKKSPTARNQMWYFDPQGVIHSALNDLILESHGGNQVRMMPFNHQGYQQWTVVGNRIVNKSGECLDIQGGQNKDGAAVVSYGYKGSANQHWRLEFI